jgi:hypothetical protein
MNVKMETFLDRKGYKSGPWDAEPDRAEWKDEATGLNCLAKRNSHSGHWCGYVGVSPGHPWYEKTNYDVHPEVHGGLTCADHCQDDDRPMHQRICHVPDPGEPEHLWWFGFDCGHHGDVSPGYDHGFSGDEQYRNFDYVRGECQQLALQASLAVKEQS